MGSLLQDARFAWSTMLKKPGFTAVTLTALILGIGANTAIFSVVNSVLLRPLPYRDADRLVRVYDSKPGEFEQFPVSPGNFTHWRDRTASFDEVAAFYVGPPLVVTGGRGPEELEGARVSANVFELLRDRPLLGRTFTRPEEEWGRHRVVLLSHTMWQRRFGGDPRVIGRTITLSDTTYTVIGVMPKTFAFPSESTQAWVPLGFEAEDLTKHGSHYLTVLARLKDGAAIEKAAAEMNVLADRLARQRPDTNAGWRTRVISWQEDVSGPLRAPLLILTAAVLFVLLIACVNVTNLLLARGTLREREVAVRMALGADRGRVVRQLLTESLLLSLTGGLGGLVLALIGVKLLGTFGAAALPMLAGVGVDWRVLVFSVVVSILTGVVFGLAPAIQTSRTDLNTALTDAARSSTPGPRRNRLRKLLVVAEVSLALVLLIGAGLLIRSFLKLRNVDPGFQPKNVLTMNVALSRVRYEEDPQQGAFFARLEEAVAALPGVQAASVVSPLPLNDDINAGFALNGQPVDDPARLPNANYYLAGPGYFRTMGIPLLKGRAFTAADREGSPRVAIINATLARKYFGDADPIGKRVFVTTGDESWREIVGVAADVKQYGLDTEPRPQIYEPYRQLPFFAMTLAVRSEGDPAALTPAILDAVRRLDKDQPVSAIRTMEEVVAGSLALRRFSMILLAMFAGVALLLAAMGIYAVVSFSVSERTREIGIRVAIGATERDILKLMVGQAALLIAIGTVIGTGAALGLTRLMASLLFGVGAADRATFIGVSVILAVVALLASYIPARRAARLDPVVAMRQ